MVSKYLVLSLGITTLAAASPLAAVAAVAPALPPVPAAPVTPALVNPSVHNPNKSSGDLAERDLANKCSSKRQKFNVITADEVLDVPHLVSSQVVQGCAGGCSLGYSQGSSFSVGGTFALLAGVELKAIVPVSLTINVGGSVTAGTSEGVTAGIACPAGTRCGMQARPVLVHLTGTTTWEKGKKECTNPPTKKFEVWQPALVEGITKEINQVKVHYSGCYMPGFGPKYRDASHDYPFCPDSLNPKGAKSTMKRN